MGRFDGRAMGALLAAVLLGGCYGAHEADHPTFGDPGDGDGGPMHHPSDAGPVDTGMPPVARDARMPPPDDVPPPIEPTHCDENPTGTTQTYVVDTLDFGVADPTTGQTPGFNLDKATTQVGGATGCGAMDWVYDVDGNGTLSGWEHGIDNQLASLAGTLSAFLDIGEAIRNGQLRLTVIASGLNGAVDDSCVDIQVIVEQGGGQVSAQLQGVLTNGRVQAGPVDLVLSIPVTGAVIDLSIHDAQIAFDLGTGRLENGVVGGGLDIDELVDAVSSIPNLPVDPETIRSFLYPVADLDADASGMCQGISAGLVFEAGASP